MEGGTESTREDMSSQMRQGGKRAADTGKSKWESQKLETFLIHLFIQWMTPVSFK